MRRSSRTAHIKDGQRSPSAVTGRWELPCSQGDPETADWHLPDTPFLHTRRHFHSFYWCVGSGLNITSGGHLGSLPPWPPPTGISPHGHQGAGQGHADTGSHSPSREELDFIPRLLKGLEATCGTLLHLSNPPEGKSGDTKETWACLPPFAGEKGVGSPSSPNLFLVRPTFKQNCCTGKGKCR